MGGFSSERDVSIRSGLAIYQGLQELGYDAVAIDVDRDVVARLKKEKIRVAFLALHGGTGEDGSMQGLLEVMGIPYTGSGVLASALAMDKEMSKKVFVAHGLNVAPYIVVRQKVGREKAVAAGETDISGAFIYPDVPELPFGPPWIVKPASEGSSIGVAIVREKDGLKPAIEETFRFGRRVIVEQFIEGKELHIGILGNRALGGVEVRPSKEFYNYEAKYTSGLTEYIIPPEVDEETMERIKSDALKAHMALGCSGADRVDFIVDREGKPFILEVNTLPGMTETSLLPKIARSAGLQFNNLIEEILRIALKE
jgi:D-alanine-D-alanine ligase